MGGILGAFYVVVKALIGSRSKSESGKSILGAGVSRCSTASEKNSTTSFIKAGEGETGEGCGREGTVDQLLQGIVHLREVVATLSSKIDCIEHSIRSGCNDKNIQLPQVSDIATQTEIMDIRTYADIVRYGTSKEKKENIKQPAQQTTQKLIPHKKQEKQEKQKSNINSNTDNKANDVKKAAGGKKSHDVKITDDDKSTNKIPKPPRRNINNDDLPVTFFIHDSTMSNVDPDRLGLSYGSHIHSKRAYTTEYIEFAVDSLTANTSKPPDAIVIHCGINDIKKKSPHSASTNMIKCITNIKHKHPNSKMIISNIAPTHDSKLEIKRHAFNAILSTELYGKKGIIVISHENIFKNNKYIRGDRIHPTKRGASVLAGNVGRAIRDLFWVTPRRRLPPRPQRNHDTNKQYNHHNTSWWNNRYNVLYQY